MADGRWRMADGGWRMADGGWRMADDRWRMADGGWRMENAVTERAGQVSGCQKVGASSRLHPFLPFAFCLFLYLGARKWVAPSAHYPFLVLSKEGLLGEHGAPFCPHSRRFCLCERRGFRICRDNLRCICSDNGYITQGPVTTSVLGRGVLLVLIADYRGGVTCL